MNTSKNFKAKKYEEHEIMLTIQNLNKSNTSVTDFIFSKDGSLKMIASELGKDELKKVINKMIDNYYKKY